MDLIAKRFPKIVKFLGFLGVISGYTGMAFILYTLITQTFKFLTVEGTAPPLAPVLPGVDIPGAPNLSFVHWILVIFIIAVVHEFSHGVLARYYNVKVKSSGFAFLGPILAAFVEPDEKVLQKKKYAQLAVYSAGPFANILFALLVVLAMQFLFIPITENTLVVEGVSVGKVIEGYPMEKIGIGAPFTIHKINNITISSPENFFDAISSFNPGKQVQIFTDKGDFTLVSVENPDNSSKGFIGITEFEFKYVIPEKYDFLPDLYIPFLEWMNLFLVWLFIISLGVGLFNLLPLGPIDGGRIFYSTLLNTLKDKKKALKIYNFISLFVLLLIIINLLPYLFKFLGFIFKPLAILFGL